MARQCYFHRIFVEGKEVGYIQIMLYSGMHPQIEYDLDDKYHNKGIMTKELTAYLDRIKDKFKTIVAIVKDDNLASMKVLDKVGFTETKISIKIMHKFYMKKF